MKFIFFLMLMLISSCSFSEPLSLAHEINNYINKNKNEANLFLETVVNIDSQTKHLNGVKEVGAKFENELKSLGFKTYWEEMPKEMKRAGNLFGIRKGNKGKRLLLIGHLDTVFPSSPQHRFQYLPNNWAKGIGVSDMKGGDVVIIQALKALQSLNLLEDTTIAVAFMGDEENSGQPHTISRALLIKLAKESDVVLDFESGPPSLGRRGITRWTLETMGLQQHSSLIFQPQVGYGAIYEMARILNQFAYRFAHTENLTINPSIVCGGTSLNFNAEERSGTVSGQTNVVAKTGVASGDLRYISDNQKLQTEKTMNKIVHANYPHTKAKISFTDLTPPMTPNFQNVILLHKLQSINHFFTATKLSSLPPKLRGGGDISFIAKYVPAGLVGLGPIGKYEHSLDEIVDLNSMHTASKRAALLIYMLTKQK